MRVIAILFILSLLACQSNDKKTDPAKKTISSIELKTQQLADSIKVAAIKDSTLLFEAKKVMNFIAKKDYVNLATCFHSDGVRFSLYGTIDTASDLVIKKEDFSKNLAKKRKWGIEYGSEETISLNTANYFKRHVYDADFLSVEKPTCNTAISIGTLIINTAEYYKDCDFVEFHKEGTNPKFDGMDWRTLQLIFKKEGNLYLLKGIVHNEWTP